MARISPRVLWVVLGLWFFGLTALAASFFPAGYDWQRVVISSLDSPRDNPHAYGIACVGLAGTGLFLLAFVRVLRDKLATFAPQTTRWAGGFFAAGALSMTLSALIVPGHYHVLGIGRMHEHLAQISATAFCLALVLYFLAVLRLPRTLKRIRLLLATITVLPVVGFATNRLLLLGTYAFSSAEHYRAMKAAYWSSLALWEWIAALCLYAFLGLMTWNFTALERRV